MQPRRSDACNSVAYQTPPISLWCAKFCTILDLHIWSCIVLAWLSGYSRQQWTISFIVQDILQNLLNAQCTFVVDDRNLQTTANTHVCMQTKSHFGYFHVEYNHTQSDAITFVKCKHSWSGLSITSSQNSWDKCIQRTAIDYVHLLESLCSHQWSH